MKSKQVRSENLFETKVAPGKYFDWGHNYPAPSPFLMQKWGQTFFTNYYFLNGSKGVGRQFPLPLGYAPDQNAWDIK